MNHIEFQFAQLCQPWDRIQFGTIGKGSDEGAER